MLTLWLSNMSELCGISQRYADRYSEHNIVQGKQPQGAVATTASLFHLHKLLPQPRKQAEVNRDRRRSFAELQGNDFCSKHLLFYPNVKQI